MSTQLKPIHTVTSDATELSCLCRVRFAGVNWIPDNSGLSPTETFKSVPFPDPKQDRGLAPPNMAGWIRLLSKNSRRRRDYYLFNTFTVAQNTQSARQTTVL